MTEYNTINSRVLSEYHNATVRMLNADEDRHSFDEEQGLHYDACSDLAVSLLASLGLEPDDRDDAGQSISGDVQTLLTLAAFRSVPVRELFAKLSANPEFFESI